jgi:hypothetical protein
MIFYLGGLETVLLEQMMEIRLSIYSLTWIRTNTSRYVLNYPTVPVSINVLLAVENKKGRGYPGNVFWLW